MTSKPSKAAYLQKYLSKDTVASDIADSTVRKKKRRRRKESSSAASSVRVHDTDVIVPHGASSTTNAGSHHHRSVFDSMTGGDNHDDDGPIVVETSAEDLPTIANPEAMGQWTTTTTVNNKNADLSPPRRNQRNEGRTTTEDSSPPRRRKSRVTEDSSPPRKSRVTEDSSPPRRRSAASNSISTDTKQLSLQGGLHSAKEFEAKELKRRAEAEQAMGKLSEKELGKDVGTIYRDKKGRKLDMLQEMMRQKEIQEGKRAREAKEEYEWGTGSVQKQMRQSKATELAEIQAKPFSRFRNDATLEQEQKEAVRLLDPMHSRAFDSGVKDKKKEKKMKKKVYKGPAGPENRFSILPGYRWDGVVRGTGWEEKVLMKQNNSKAAQDEDYQRSTRDM